MSQPVIMLNMQSLAWHFKFAWNLVLFPPKPTRADFFFFLGHRTLQCIKVLGFHLCSNNWMCEEKPLVSHTGVEFILATKKEPIKEPNNTHSKSEQCTRASALFFNIHTLYSSLSCDHSPASDANSSDQNILGGPLSVFAATWRAQGWVTNYQAAAVPLGRIAGRLCGFK